MTLQLGSHGPQVSRWTDVMLRRFKSYALGVDGTPLRNDGYFGRDEEKVQREYERRTNQLMDGIVSDHDLGALGLALPIIFTVEGHASQMLVRSHRVGSLHPPIPRCLLLAAHRV